MSHMTSHWKDLPQMTTTRFVCAAVAANGKLYAVGGRHGGYLDSIEFFDMNDKKRWTNVPARMRDERYGCAAAASGNSIYVAGGDDGLDSYFNLVEAFDVDSGLWRTLPSMHTRRYCFAAVAVNDEFLVFGGRGNSLQILNTAESFNVRTGRWNDLPPMKNNRYGCAAAVINNKIYVVGGWDGRSRLDTVEVFDLSTRTWILLPNRMKTKVSRCAAASVGNYLVVAGGHDGTSALNAVTVYDVEAETWTELPPMSTKRTGCAAVSLGGSVYIVGGHRDGRTYLDTVEEIQFNDDVVKGMLLEWRDGSWRNEVLPLLHRRTSVIHKLDLDVTVMPTLLGRISQEERVPTIFDIVREEMSIFQHT